MPLEVGSTVVEVLCELIPNDQVTITTLPHLEEPCSLSNSLKPECSSHHTECQVTLREDKVREGRAGTLKVLMVNDSCYAVFFQPQQVFFSSNKITENESNCIAVDNASPCSNSTVAGIAMDVDVDADVVNSNVPIDANTEAEPPPENTPIFSSDLDSIDIFPLSKLVHFPMPNDFYVVMPEPLEFKMFQDAMYECREIANATLRIQAVTRDTYYAGVYRNLPRVDMLKPMALTDRIPSRDIMNKINLILEGGYAEPIEEVQSKSKSSPSKGGGGKAAQSSNTVGETATKSEVIPIVCTFCDISHTQDKTREFIIHPFVSKAYNGKPIHMCLPCVVNWNRYRNALEEADGLILPGEDNEELCAICSDTPDQLVLCETCKRSFCTPCLIRVCNTHELPSVNEDDEWNCMCCFNNEKQTPLVHEKWKLIVTAGLGKPAMPEHRPGQLYRHIQELAISQTRRLQAIAATAEAEGSSNVTSASSSTSVETLPKEKLAEVLPPPLMTESTQNTHPRTEQERRERKNQMERERRTKLRVATSKTHKTPKAEVVTQLQVEIAAENALLGTESSVNVRVPLVPLALIKNRAKGPLAEARVALLALQEQQEQHQRQQPRHQEQQLDQHQSASSRVISKKAPNVHNSSNLGISSSVAPLSQKRQRQVSSRVLASTASDASDYLLEQEQLQAVIHASLKDSGRQGKATTQTDKRKSHKKKTISLVSKAPELVEMGLIDPSAANCAADSDEPETVIVCDGCDAEFFIRDIGITQVPDDDWFCNFCIDTGVSKRKKKRTSTVEAKKVTKLMAPPPPPARGSVSGVVVGTSNSKNKGTVANKTGSKVSTKSDNSDTWYFHKYVIVADDLVHQNEIYENHTENGFETEEACYLCKDGGQNLFQCDHCIPNCEVRNYRSGTNTTVPGRCRKVYHGYCLMSSPDESSNEEWRCPRHYCDGCGTTALDFVCRYCPISLCMECKRNTKLFTRYVELERPKFGWEFLKRTKPICCGRCLDMMDQCQEEGKELTSNGATHSALLKKPVPLQKLKLSEAPRSVSSGHRGHLANKSRQVIEPLSKQMQIAMEMANEEGKSTTDSLHMKSTVKTGNEVVETSPSSSSDNEEEPDEGHSPSSGVMLSWSDLNIDDSTDIELGGKKKKEKVQQAESKKPRGRHLASQKSQPNAGTSPVNEDHSNSNKASTNPQVKETVSKKPPRGRPPTKKGAPREASTTSTKPPESKTKQAKVPVDKDAPKAKGRPPKEKLVNGKDSSSAKAPKAPKVFGSAKPAYNPPTHKPKLPALLTKNLRAADDGVSHMMRDVLDNPDADQPRTDPDSVSFRIPIPQSDDTENEGYSSMAVAHI